MRNARKINISCVKSECILFMFRKLSELELELKDKHESLVTLERREEKVTNELQLTVARSVFLDCKHRR